jgi:hypothetical protein
MRKDLAEENLFIPLVGVEGWLNRDDLWDSVVIQQNNGEAILRLANSQVVVVNSIDLDFDERDNNA